MISATSGSRIARSNVCSSVSFDRSDWISIMIFVMFDSISRVCFDVSDGSGQDDHWLTLRSVSASVAFWRVSIAAVLSFIPCCTSDLRMYALMKVGSSLMAYSASLRASGRANNFVYAAARLLYDFGSMLHVSWRWCSDGLYERLPLDCFRIVLDGRCKVATLRISGHPARVCRVLSP